MTDWHEIADTLAARLMHHAFCAQHAQWAEGCPFCADRKAYADYLAAGGTVRLSEFKGRRVRIEDTPRDDDA